MLLLFGATITAHAEVEVSVSVRPESGTVNEQFRLEVTLRGEQAKEFEPPIFEENSDFEIFSAGTASNISIVNGRSNTAFSHVFTVQPNSKLEPGRYSLPRGYFVRNGKKVFLKDQEITIVKDDSAPAKQKELGVDVVQTLNNTAPYVGEQVLYEFKIVTNRRLYNAAVSEPSFPGFWHEPFEKNDETHRTYGQQSSTIYTIRAALFAFDTGELRIPGRILTAELPVQRKRTRLPDPWRDGWGGFFDFDLDTGLQLTKRKFTANDLTVEVKQLPENPLKSSGYVPVGKVQIASALDKSTVTQGSSVTLTVELYGDANLRPYELPPLGEADKKNFRVYLDKPDLKTFYEGTTVKFKKRFSMALVPLKAGELPLPVFTVVTFDPQAQEYRALQTSTRSVSVLPDKLADQLVVSRGVDTPTTLERPEEEKDTVVLLGEDLLPQHVGPELYRRAPRINTLTFFFLLFLLPLVSLLLRFIAGHHLQLRLNPHLLAERSALIRASSSLDGLTDGADLTPIMGVITRYLGERFRRHGESLTSIEAATLVSEKTNDSGLGDRTRELLAKLERYRYGGGSRSGAEAEKESLLEQARVLLREIEKKTKR